MASPIELVIEDLEEYIDACKPSAFSSSKIVVNRDEIEGIISELKSKIPIEVNKYQKIINNQESILAEAKRQAKEIIAAAEIHTSELVSEHQIMQQAYAQANEVVMIATKDAQNTIDSATRDANEIRSSAIAYTDELLKSVQEVLVRSIETTRSRQDSFITTMQGYLDTVTENRIALAPNPIAEEIMNTTPEQILAEAEMEAKKAQAAKAAEPPKEMQIEQFEVEIGPDTPIDLYENGEGSAPQTTGVIDIPEDFFKKD